MHDRNGTELRTGDIVVIEAEVTDLQPQADADYCNVNIEPVKAGTVNGQTPMSGTMCTCTKFLTLLRRSAVALLLLLCLAMPVFAQTTAPADGGGGAVLAPSLKVQLGTISGIMVLTLLLVQAAKKALAGVPALQSVPLWAYSTAIATALTCLARYAIGCLAGDIVELLWQANLAAILAVGGFSVLRQPGATPANSAKAAAGGQQKSGGGRTWAGLWLAVGLAGLAGDAGCMWNPSDAVKGAQGTLAIYDANSDKPAIEYITGGASVAAAKIRLADSPRTGRTLTIGSVTTEDTVAEGQASLGIRQQDAFLVGFQSAMAAAVAFRNGSDIQWPTGGTGQPAGTAASTGGGVMELLGRADLSDEEALVLIRLIRRASSTPAATPARPKAAKAPKAPVPLESLAPATRPAGGS